MNQILITKKLYVTPELKRKKKIYRFNFIISVFLVCILISFYIYAEYARNRDDKLSQEILSNFNENLEQNQEDTTIAKDNILIVVLDENKPNDLPVTENVENNNNTNVNNKITTRDGYKYGKIASINIPKINVNYAILDGETKTPEETEALLKISPTKFWGPNPHEVGNLCIVGHNYRNTKFFSKVPTLENGDIIEITDLDNKTLRYSVYDKYQVNPNDLSCTSQLTNGNKEITLITCTSDNKMRVIVKARVV